MDCIVHLRYGDGQTKRYSQADSEVKVRETQTVLLITLAALVLLLTQRGSRKTSALDHIKNRLGTLKFGTRKLPVRGIVIHHTATPSAAVTEAVLKDRGLSTMYEVDQNGTIYQYGDPETQYAYATGGGANSHTIAIDVTHTSKAPWPKAQIDATRDLVQALASQYDLTLVPAPDDGVQRSWAEWQQATPRPTLFRHRNFKQTACPEDFPVEAMV